MPIKLLVSEGYGKMMDIYYKYQGSIYCSRVSCKGKRKDTAYLFSQLTITKKAENKLQNLKKKNQLFSSTHRNNLFPRMHPSGSTIQIPDFPEVALENNSLEYLLGTCRQWGLVNCKASTTMASFMGGMMRWGGALARRLIQSWGLATVFM